MKFKGELLFEGKFNGESIEGDDLVIGEQAEIRAATVKVVNFTSSGLVEGNVEVSEKAALKGAAHIEGNLSTFRLAMDDGASFSGGLSVRKPGTAV